MEMGQQYKFADSDLNPQFLYAYIFDRHEEEKLSPVYISKIFKSETGETPINYLISLRMEKAGKLLEENPMLSIQKVADEVGYDDAYHFSKLFKKYYGISPVYYKRNNYFPAAR